MKEASGELSMTAIAVVAIVAVGGLFTVFIWPSLKGALKAKTYCASAFNCDACNGKTKKCHSWYEGDNTTPQTGELSCSCDGQ